MDSFQELRHLLEGAAHRVIVYTDHKNLEYFMSAHVLNRRQVRWNMSLSRFDFIITYRSGKQQGLSDALSRRSYLISREGEVAYDQQQMALLKPKQFQLGATTMALPVDSLFLDQVRAASKTDPLIHDIKHQAHQHGNNFKLLKNLLYFEECLYIPEGHLRLQVLQT